MQDNLESVVYRVRRAHRTMLSFLGRLVWASEQSLFWAGTSRFEYTQEHALSSPATAGNATPPLPMPAGQAGFPQFARLPAELRLAIWKAALASPAMHVFDMCLSGAETGATAPTRTELAFGLGQGQTPAVGSASAIRYGQFQDRVFLDVHRGGADGGLPEQRRDPSMYKWEMALASTSADALSAASSASSSSPAPTPAAAAVFGEDVNTVYLPGPDRLIQYNNRTDVLHLCLPPPPPAAAVPRRCTLVPLPAAAGDGGATLGLLDAEWSNAMGETLRTARHVALNAADTVALIDMAGPMVEAEIAMLASTLFARLDVLYLVDYCPGRGCASCARLAWPRDGVAASAADAPRGVLYAKLNADDGNNGRPARAPDVVHGAGRVYREVFDLERLGWRCESGVFVFAQALGEAIRTMQAEALQPGRFRGVRVLVAEDG